MPVFGIMHTIKLKAGNTMGVQLENNRTKKDCERTFAGSQIEWDMTDENVHWVHSGNWDKSAYELCQKYDVQKVKKDSVIALQTVYTASREWFTMDENGNPIFDEKAEQFFRDCMKFHVENYCGGREDLLINAVVHLDEIHADGTGSLHFHCTSVPIAENERGEYVLSAKRVLGGRKEMTQSQTKFHNDVCKSRGMERGMSSNETTGVAVMKIDDGGDLANFTVTVTYNDEPVDFQILDAHTFTFVAKELGDYSLNLNSTAGASVSDVLTIS